jgi:hypothetical protein
MTAELRAMILHWRLLISLRHLTAAPVSPAANDNPPTRRTA